MLSSDEHLTAKQITERVQRISPRVRESTIYRVLDRFETVGVAKHVNVSYGPSRWHHTPTIHLHLFCDHCAQLIDVYGEPINQFV